LNIIIRFLQVFFLFHMSSFYFFLVFLYFILKSTLVNSLLKVQCNVGEWLQFLKVIFFNELETNKNIENFHPGLGISMSIMSFFLTIYYTMLIGYAILYLVLSFRSKLDWTTCGAWASPSISSKCIFKKNSFFFY
jgi:SNF family Na+-dependent transporter